MRICLTLYTKQTLQKESRQSRRSTSSSERICPCSKLIRPIQRSRKRLLSLVCSALMMRKCSGQNCSGKLLFCSAHWHLNCSNHPLKGRNGGAPAVLACCYCCSFVAIHKIGEYHVTGSETVWALRKFQHRLGVQATKHNYGFVQLVVRNCSLVVPHKSGDQHGTPHLSNYLSELTA